nr:PREDICTED: uncharacterized protein C11orf85 homolog isoform X1 [Latimeria chalumnae]|eukprot:XP_014349142.1 PREDICTED: uncharacterized protein C11orf85 homolog isoform X1 [Latimeria chalumnae]
MPLKPFSYPNSETRFLHAGMTLFKFKIRYGNAPSREGLENDGSNTQELEDAIRAVLGNLDALQPFTTKHFTIFPYKSKWVRVSELRFKHRNSFLTPYPYVCTLYVQVNSKQQNINYGNEATSRQSSQQVKAIQDSDPLFAATQHRLVDSSSFPLSNYFLVEESPSNGHCCHGVYRNGNTQKCKPDGIFQRVTTFLCLLRHPDELGEGALLGVQLQLPDVFSDCTQMKQSLC